MFVKIYGTMWAIFLLAASVLFLTGNFGLTAVVVSGFISFGLIFMGMMCVLPSVVSHPPKARPAQTAKETRPVIERVRGMKKDWMSSNGVEVRTPRYR